MRYDFSLKTRDLPNTYSRSTAETAMNPIGQNIPVICLHFEATTNRGLEVDGKCEDSGTRRTPS